MLHVVFDAGEVYHSWSEDDGNTWLPEVPPWPQNRELVPYPNMFGNHGGAIGLDPDGNPWVTAAHPGGIEDPQDRLQGATKVNDEWHSGVILSDLFMPPYYYAQMGRTSTAVSKYDDPALTYVAYSVVPVYEHWVEPTYRHYLFLVAWGMDENGYVQRFGDYYQLDYQHLPGETEPCLKASVAVQRTWAGDVVHVVWQRKEARTSRIYHVESEPITPEQVRAGEPLQWGDWTRVSTGEPYLTEPATYPSVDWEEEDVTDVEWLIVTWHGPDDEGNFPGDAWRRRRMNHGWEDPRNVSYDMTSPANWESDFPEPSTRFVVAWQEEVENEDWEIYGNFRGFIETIVRREGPDLYPHAAAKHREGIVAIDCHTLWTRPEDYSVCYKLYRWVPRGGSGPGGQASGWMRIGRDEAVLYPIAPATSQSGAVLRYFLPNDARVELSVFDQAGREDVPILVEIEESGSPARMVSSGQIAKGEPREKVQEMVDGGKSEGTDGWYAGTGRVGPGRSA